MTKGKDAPPEPPRPSLRPLTPERSFAGRAEAWLWRAPRLDAVDWLSSLVSRWSPLAIPAPCPTRGAGVVVIGGLSLGGAGSTPAVAHLARRAHQAGLRVAVVGHGYRGRGGAPTEVTDSPGALQRAGDEALMLKRALPDAISVWTGQSRCETVGRARAEGVEVVLVDGGLFDHALARYASIAVLDAVSPRRVFPAGPLRAPPSRLEGADLVWLHGVDEPGARPLAAARVESAYRIAAVELATGRRVDAGWLAGLEVTPVSGIARPESFYATLRAAGAIIRGAVEVGDHGALPGARLRSGPPTGSSWITTAKDHARWPSPEVPVLVVHVAVDIRRGQDTLDALVARAGALGKAA